MSGKRAVYVMAHYPHDESMRTATLSGTDVSGILRVERNVAADGGWITIDAGGAEYPVAAWVAYVSGITDSCAPLEVTA